MAKYFLSVLEKDGDSSKLTGTSFNSPVHNQTIDLEAFYDFLVEQNKEGTNEIKAQAIALGQLLLGEMETEDQSDTARANRLTKAIELLQEHTVLLKVLPVLSGVFYK